MIRPGPRPRLSSPVIRSLSRHGVTFRNNGEAEIPSNSFTQDAGGCEHIKAEKSKEVKAPEYSPALTAPILTQRDSEMMWEDYNKLAQRFPLRCKYGGCSGKFSAQVLSSF